MLRRAAEWPADAVLIAGNLFDLAYVSRETVAFLQAEFESVRPMPVLIAPGTADPYTPESPYVTASWPSNVLIFDKPEWQSHALREKQLVVHGFAHDAPTVPLTALAGLRITPRPGWVQVALAHGPASAVAGENEPAREHLTLEAADLALPGLDYLALGHTPERHSIENNAGVTAWRAGPPQGHGFDETGIRHYLEVEIGADGVTVHSVEGSKRLFAVYRLDCGNYATPKQLATAIRALADRAALPQIARVRLVGASTRNWQVELPDIRDAVASRFEHLQVLDESECREELDAAAVDDTGLGLLIQRLSAEIADAPDSNRKALVARARDLGLAAFRQRELPIPGLEED